MKTEYQARGSGVKCPWTDDLNHVRENFCAASDAQLWRRETETPEEAAVRRMDWLEVACLKVVINPSGDKKMLIPYGSTVAAEIDRVCPPPPAAEARLDWDTLEPWKEPPVMNARGVFVAGIDRADWINRDLAEVGDLLLDGRIALGATREAALRNLDEMRRVAK